MLSLFSNIILVVLPSIRPMRFHSFFVCHAISLKFPVLSKNYLAKLSEFSRHCKAFNVLPLTLYISYHLIYEICPPCSSNWTTVWDQYLPRQVYRLQNNFIPFQLISFLYRSTSDWTLLFCCSRWSRVVAETCVWKPANVRISSMKYLLADDSKTLSISL